MSTHVKPSEMEYSDYMENAEYAADAVIERMNEWEDSYGDLHEAVWEVVDSSKYVNNYGYNLSTVMLSDTNPDSPDYCEPWTTYADLSSDPSWSDVVTAMAYVCFYSDVVEHIKRGEDE